MEKKGEQNLNVWNLNVDIMEEWVKWINVREPMYKNVQSFLINKNIYMCVDNCCGS